MVKEFRFLHAKTLPGHKILDVLTERGKNTTQVTVREFHCKFYVTESLNNYKPSVVCVSPVIPGSGLDLCSNKVNRVRAVEAGIRIIGPMSFKI